MINKKKQDNEVYFLGSESKKETNKTSGQKWIAILILLFLVITGILSVIYLIGENKTPDYYFEPEEETTQQSISVATTDTNETLLPKGYIEVTEETVNDVPLTVYTPHHAIMSLCLGMPNPADTTILYTAMAADIRRDNMEIVGDFVLSGKRLARGVAKKGFCAIEKDTITIGVGESTPLLQSVIENSGSFFRQYPLVQNGELVENKPKNKSIRRALAVRNERIVMVESKNKESFHDFSQALIDIGVSDAIYLVGGDAYGWYQDKEYIRKEFGVLQPELPENISYIIWRIK